MAMAGLQLVCGLVLFVLVVEPMATTALSCGDMISQTGACIGYLQNSGGNRPPTGCCNGIRSLNNRARNTRDRQTVCQCLKNVAKAMRDINYGLADKLPDNCGVRFPYKINPSTDCSRV